MSDSIDDQFARVLELHDPAVRDVAWRAVALIRELLPDACEQVDFGNGLIAFGTGPTMRDLLFAVIPHRAHANIQFVEGVDLPDPACVLEGTGKRARHVKCRSAADVDRPAVRGVVAAQIALGRSRAG